MQQTQKFQPAVNHHQLLLPPSLLSAISRYPSHSTIMISGTNNSKLRASSDSPGSKKPVSLASANRFAALSVLKDDDAVDNAPAFQTAEKINESESKHATSAFASNDSSVAKAATGKSKSKSTAAASASNNASRAKETDPHSKQPSLGRRQTRSMTQARDSMKTRRGLQTLQSDKVKRQMGKSLLDIESASEYTVYDEVVTADDSSPKVECIDAPASKSEVRTVNGDSIATVSKAEVLTVKYDPNAPAFEAEAHTVSGDPNAIASKAEVLIVEDDSAASAGDTAQQPPAAANQRVARTASLQNAVEKLRHKIEDLGNQRLPIGPRDLADLRALIWRFKA
jgi:hypothetical protein